MKTKSLTLITCLILSLSLNLGSALANESTPSSPGSSRTYNDQTPWVTDYLDKLRTNCKFNVDEFEKIRDAASNLNPTLANPMSENRSLLNIKCRQYWVNYNVIITKLNKAQEQGIKLVDFDKVADKAEQLIYEITDNEYKREEAIEQTENINIEMDFATIPAGTYTSRYQEIGTYEIPEGIEIQTTPVTQYQWAKVMGDNPAYFKDGEYARIVEIDTSSLQGAKRGGNPESDPDSKQIDMYPNRPIESVSYEDITNFITKLSAYDSEYEYQLPSLKEYLAVIEKSSETLLSKESACLDKTETCHVEFSSQQYISNKPIYSVLDNILEFTRDYLRRNDLYIPINNRILFGTSYYSKNIEIDQLEKLTRLILDKSSIDNNIGFRLTRIKKKSL